MSSNCRRRVASGLFLLYTFSRRPCFCVSCGKAGCSNTWQPCLKSKYLHDAISLCGRRNEGQTGTKISYLHIWHFPTTQFIYSHRKFPWRRSREHSWNWWKCGNDMHGYWSMSSLGITFFCSVAASRISLNGDVKCSANEILPDIVLTA